MNEGASYSVVSAGVQGAAKEVTRWIAANSNVPLEQRHLWPATDPAERLHMLVVRSPSGHELGAVGVREWPLRSLPGFRVLRVLRFGVGLSVDAVGPAVVALKDYARSRPEVLRLHVEAFAPEPSLLDAITRACLAAEYTRERAPRQYERTLLVDLTGTDAEFIGRFDRMVMKNVRKSERSGHVVAPITETRFAPRLARLVEETMGRTGGAPTRHDWESIIGAARDFPNHFRLAGLFLNAQHDPASLVAFRWCGCAGDYADDLVAASTRVQAGAGAVPMMPAIMLHMFRWAREQGARTFDFGGVLEASDPRYARLGGITEFKRLFGDDECTVGADFTYTAHPRLSRAAEFISRNVRRVRGQ